MSSSVAIVIPFRDPEPRWFGLALQSALAQTHRPGEIWVVDDGSGRSYEGLIKELGEPIHLLSGPPSGGNHARNRGSKAASTEWIQFLDADDYLESDKIERQLGELGAAGIEADVLYSPVWVEEWRNGAMVKRDLSPLDCETDLYTQWISWQLPQTGGALWRAAALSRIGGWKEGLPCCQEHELYLRAIQIGLRFQFCPTPGAVYRIWSEQTVCRKDPIMVIRERTRLIDDMLGWLKKTDRLRTIHIRTAAKEFFQMARTWARYNLEEASAYFRQRSDLGLIRVEGPAAPWKYRVAQSLFGFAGAERIAGWQRTK